MSLSGRTTSEAELAREASARPTGPGVRGAVAIIGMSCLYPGSDDVDAFWSNILGKVDSITEPPPEAAITDRYFDPESSESDRVYCKRGGYLGSLVTFDPLEHGIPPLDVGGEPDQWLALKIAKDALADAGYPEPEEAVRHRTAVILGKGTYLNGGNAMAVQHGLIVGQTLELLKALHPQHTDETMEGLRHELKKSLPTIGPETVPGLIPNIIVGRIANRLDLMGPTYTVDAACASSLVAVQMAMRDLLSGECDLALAGGSQVWIPLPTLGMFCQLGALSRRQQIRPFDKDADGTLLGEGIGMVVLKRLEDAERDGDRIYAVVRGVGVASDGRGTTVMAPRVEGEELALRRAYEAAGVSPGTIGLIEAHGTGTPVGDAVEILALTRVFGERVGELPRCAIGSVKSMISHTIPASGVAGIIKTALALHHKVLPPSLNCTEPNPKLELEKTPFYVNVEARPWVNGGKDPRRAGVNSFGFGGINAHAVLEEYVPAPERRLSDRHFSRLPALPGLFWPPLPLGEGWGEGRGSTSDVRRQGPIGPRETGDAPHPRPLSQEERGDRPARDPHRSAEEKVSVGQDRRWGPAESGAPDHLPDWETELCILGAETPAELLAAIGRLGRFLEGDTGALRLKDLASTLNRELMTSGGADSCRLAVVAGSVADLREKLGRAAGRIADPGCRRLRDVSGLYYASEPLGREGKLAFLFPGEGAQYPNMLADLCLHFPEVRECFDRADRVYADHPRGYVPSDHIFPRPTSGGPEGSWAESQLWRMDGAIEAVLTADLALLAVMEGLGLRPDVIVGHSSGEYAALRAAGVLDLHSDEQWARFARELNGDFERASSQGQVPEAVLLAVGGGRDQGEAIAREAGGGLHVAMDNCPHQVVLIGETAAAERALEIVRREGLVAERLAFDRPYHTPLFAPFTDHLRQVIDRLTLSPARTPIYSCTTAAPFPDDPAEARALMIEHWLRPVEFRRTVEALYDEGVRLFVEVGPRGNLTAFIEDALRGRPSCAMPVDSQRRRGTTQLNHLVGQLTVHGVEMDLAYLHRRRETRPVAWAGGAAPPSAATGQFRITLNTGFPSMSLSDEFLRQFRESSGARVAPARPPDNVEAEALPTAPVREAGPVALPVSKAGFDGGSGRKAPISLAAESYLQTMEQFLQLQARVFRGAAGPGAWPWANAFGVPRDDRSYPLLGDIVSCTPGKELVARRTFDPSEDRYLEDHTLGRDLSVSDPGLRALAIMPMTMSLEILAEAASALRPGHVVVGMLDVRAHRWIAFEDRPQTLQVEARAVPGGEPPRSPVIEATVVLADDFPAPVGPLPAIPPGGRPSRLAADELYREHMFHGPSWRGVAAIDQTGPAGTVATLRVLPTRGYFREIAEPRFDLDPAVLDAAGQVVGFWTIEHLDRGRVVFPFRVERLEIHGPSRPAGELLRCVTAVELIGEQLVRSDIDVIDGDGRSWLRIVGWEDKRFDLPGHLTPLMHPTGSGDVSEPWAGPIAHLAEPDLFECRVIRTDLPSDRGFWERVWAHRMLGRGEREQFRRLGGGEARRLEWLGGRAAAKEAVRALLWLHHGLDVPLPDIEIRLDEHGRPLVDGPWRDAVPGLPVVSITHTEGLAIAAAGLSAALGGGDLLLGVNAEYLRTRPAGFAEAAFDGQELRLIRSLPTVLQEEWTLRAWCAREAVAKATGFGLVMRPRSARLAAVDPESDEVTVRLDGHLAGAFPGLTEAPLAVTTGRHGDLVIALMLRELAGPEPVGGAAPASSRAGTGQST